MRKPFDVIAEGLLVQPSRGDSHCTFVNEIAGSHLVLAVLPKLTEFEGNAVTSLVTPGLYSKRKQS